MHEGIPIHNFLVPKAFTHEAGRLDRRRLREGRAALRRARAAATWCRRASRTSTCLATTCWSPSARRTPSPGSSPTAASPSTAAACRWSIPSPTQSSNPRVLFGGDAAFGPKNIIWAVAHGHAAAVSIDKLCHGEDTRVRPPPGVTLSSQKMGIHEWSYDNDISLALRNRVPTLDNARALADLKLEVELGYDEHAGLEGGAALPELRRADRLLRQAVHRVRRLRRHLPDGLHHLHAQRAGAGAAPPAHRTRTATSPRISTSRLRSRPAG